MVIMQLPSLCMELMPRQVVYAACDKHPEHRAY